MTEKMHFFATPHSPFARQQHPNIIRTNHCIPHLLVFPPFYLIDRVKSTKSIKIKKKKITAWIFLVFVRLAHALWNPRIDPLQLLQVIPTTEVPKFPQSINWSDFDTFFVQNCWRHFFVSSLLPLILTFLATLAYMKLTDDNIQTIHPSSIATWCWPWPLFCPHVLKIITPCSPFLIQYPHTNPSHPTNSNNPTQSIPKHSYSYPSLLILDIEMNFEEAAAKAKTLPDSVTNEEKLSLYGLYKQATVGDVEGTQPWAVQVGMFFFVPWAKVETSLFSTPLVSSQIYSQSVCSLA